VSDRALCALLGAAFAVLVLVDLLLAR